MTNSKHIAGLVGPTLIATTISEALNAQIWTNVPATQTYLAGLRWFVAGLEIVRVHNYWIRDWPMAVTLVGWFLMLGGLGRMFFPVAAQQSTPSGSVVLALQMVLLAIGILLTFKAYVRIKS